MTDIEVVLAVHEQTCETIKDLYNKKSYESMKDPIEELDDQLIIIKALVKELQGENQ